MFKYESHLHTFETSNCGRVKAADQVKRYKEAGYTGICVTDHLHNDFLDRHRVHDDWEEAMRRYLYGYHLAKEAGDACGLQVILGAELRFPENESDYLVYGIDEQWLYEHPYITELDHQEFYDRFKDEVLIIHAHPYRNNDVVYWECVHGLEIANCNPRHDSRNGFALSLSKAHPQLIRTCGSDAHQIPDQCRSAMVFDRIITNSYEYKEALEKGEFKMECEEFADIIREGEKR